MDTKPNMKVYSTILKSNTFDNWVMQIPHFPLLEYENHISLGLRPRVTLVKCGVSTKTGII